MPLLSQPRLSHNTVFPCEFVDMPPNDDDCEDDQREHRDASVGNLADELSEELVSRFYAGAKGEEADDWIAHVDTAKAPRKNVLTGSGIPADVSAILKQMFDPGPAPARGPRFTPELVAKRVYIRALADELLGSVSAARQWFATPFRSALQGKTPIELMTSLEGCTQVEEFLCSLYPPEDL